MVSGDLALQADEIIKLEQRFYDQHWERAAELSQLERERIEFTTASIPVECKRILDVGSGDGRVLREAAKRPGLFVVAYDISPVALNNVPTHRCCGSAAQLPFPDHSFDLVLATEMLEHLPTFLYPQVVCELARVASRYILVTVPNCENLEEHTTVCGYCGARFHVWGHQRFYTPERIRSLFAGFALTYSAPFGGFDASYNRLLLWVRARLAGAWCVQEPTTCYWCGKAGPPSSKWPFRPFLARVCDGLNARLWGAFFKRRGWLLGLYARRGR